MDDQPHPATQHAAKPGYRRHGHPHTHPPGKDAHHHVALLGDAHDHWHPTGPTRLPDHHPAADHDPDDHGPDNHGGVQ
jgi:hypothetical protein